VPVYRVVYVDRRPAITDALGAWGVRAAAQSLRNAYTNGANLQAREEMAMAALLSGITLTTPAWGRCMVFAAPLGANFPAPHGTICARRFCRTLSLPRRSPARSRRNGTAALARLCAIGAGGDGPRGTMTGTIPGDRCGNSKMCRVGARSPTSHRLHQFGMTENDVPAMVALAKKASSMRFNPVELSMLSWALC